LEIIKCVTIILRLMLSFHVCPELSKGRLPAGFLSTDMKKFSSILFLLHVSLNIFLKYTIIPDNKQLICPSGHL